MVVHSGGMGGGHYIAYTRKRRGPRNDEGGEWHYFSDSSFKATTAANVAGAQGMALHVAPRFRAVYIYIYIYIIYIQKET